MFTGIITHQGLLRSVDKVGEDLELVITVPAGFSAGMAIGASVACNGACLTVTEKGTEKGEDWFKVLAAAETLACTTLAHWRQGSRVNLERALALGAELGGHIVTGHVDGVATLLRTEKRGASHSLTLSAPDALWRFIAAKGSVTLDGVSLTVNSVDRERFSVLVIPHTLAETSLGERRIGEGVNLEIDVIARYLERLHLEHSQGAAA
jgi:riboflavin synthase